MEDATGSGVDGDAGVASFDGAGCFVSENAVDISRARDLETEWRCALSYTVSCVFAPKIKTNS